MRFIAICLLVLVAAPTWAHSPGTPLPSAANLLRLHPGPWRPAEPLIGAALRFEPEAGEAADLAPRAARAAAQASLRAQAEADIRVLPDGSRHSVVGAALRSWTIATVDEQGRLTQDCVHGETQALRRVEAAEAARKQVRK